MRMWMGEGTDERAPLASEFSMNIQNRFELLENKNIEPLLVDLQKF
jgi:hypothetical protein